MLNKVVKFNWLKFLIFVQVTVQLQIKSNSLNNHLVFSAYNCCVKQEHVFFFRFVKALLM